MFSDRSTFKSTANAVNDNVSFLLTAEKQVAGTDKERQGDHQARKYQLPLTVRNQYDKDTEQS